MFDIVQLNSISKSSQKIYDYTCQQKIDRLTLYLFRLFLIIFPESSKLFLFFSSIILYVNQKTNTNAYLCKLVKRNRNCLTKVLNSKLHLFRPFLIIFQESSISILHGVGDEENDEDLEIGDIFLTTRKLIPSGKIVTLTPTGKRSLNLQSPRFILISIFFSSQYMHTLRK